MYKALPASQPSSTHADSVAAPAGRTTVAMLLSVFSFEIFYERVMKLDRDTYVNKYRHDFSWYYAAGLAENGIRPLMYIPSVHHDGRYETDAGVPIRFLKVAAWFRPLQQLRYLFRKTRWTLYALEWLNTVSFSKKLRAAMAEDGIDLLYVQEYWTGRFDYLAGRVPVPVMGVDQGGKCDGMFTRFKRRAFARAHRLQCQTRNECEAVEKFGGKAAFLPNGCDRQFFSPAPAGTVKGKTVLTVGRLTNMQKRTSDLIRAMTHLPADWSLDIIGSGPDREWLEKLAAQLGLAERVRFLGFKSRVEVRDAIRAAGVYAMPSSNEGMCLALLEAMSCGAAVVLTKIRAFTAVVDDGVNGVLVPVEDPAELAKGILRAYEHRDALGRAATETIARDYDAPTVYRQLSGMIETAVARHRLTSGGLTSGGLTSGGLMSGDDASQAANHDLAGLDASSLEPR